jgi:hypothetical protein
MLRKLLLATVTGLALLSPLAMTPFVDAHGGHHCKKCYEVVFRECCTAPWQCFGTFKCCFRAKRAVCKLQARGCEAFIR